MDFHLSNIAVVVVTLALLLAFAIKHGVVR